MSFSTELLVQLSSLTELSAHRVCVLWNYSFIKTFLFRPLQFDVSFPSRNFKILMRVHSLFIIKIIVKTIHTKHAISSWPEIVTEVFSWELLSWQSCFSLSNFHTVGRTLWCHSMDWHYIWWTMYMNVCKFCWLMQPFNWFITVEISCEDHVHHVL